MDTEQLIELLYNELKNQGLWFVTKKDTNWLIKPKKYYKLNEYGEIENIAKVEKEINSYLGDGAETVLEAIRIFINDGLSDGSIACNCNLNTVFKDKPVDYIETAVEVKNVEPKKIEPQITGSNKQVESKQLNESATKVISEKLNTGILPVIDVDLYSLYSNGLLDNVPDGEEDNVDKLVLEIAPEYIENAIKKVLPSAKVKALSLYHPKEYNFSGDELEFDLTISSDEYNTLKEDVVNNQDFNTFLRNNYGSYDGFISSMPDNLDDFNNSEDWKQLVQVIMFALRNEDLQIIQDEYDTVFLEKVAEEFPFSDNELDEGKKVTEDYFSKMVEIREKAEQDLIARLKEEFPKAKVSNVISSKYRGDRILLTSGDKKISIYFEDEMGEDGKPWFMILLDSKNKKSYSDNIDGIIKYLKDNIISEKITEDIFDKAVNGELEYGVYDDKDIRNIKDRYKEPIYAKRNKIRNYEDEKFTQRPIRDIINKGVTHIDYEKMPNEKSQAYKKSNKIAESAIKPEELDYTNSQKLEKIENVQRKLNEEEDMSLVKDVIEKAKENSDATAQEIDQVKGSLDVLKTDEESAITGYDEFIKETNKVVDSKLASAIDNQMQEIIKDEEEHIEKLDTIKSSLDDIKDIKTENAQRRLNEENNKSANIISDMFTAKDFDSESKMGKIVMRTSNLFNVLSDKGYDVQVSFDNGESTNVILLGQQGGQVNITIDNDIQPLKAYANGSFEITEDNMKILDDINKEIENL